MQDEVTKKIEKWVYWFKKIIDKYEDADLLIKKMKESEKNIYNNYEIDENDSNQTKDDIKFYKSIISDSIYFLEKSISIRKKKMHNDFNDLDNHFNNNYVETFLINIKNYNLIIEKYKNIKSKTNTQELKWIKDDNIETLQEWEFDMKKTLNYHNYVIDNFYKTIYNEYIFFSSDGKITNLDYPCKTDNNNIDIDSSDLE